MAQDRILEEKSKSVPTPIPNPVHTEVIDGLKEDLTNWMQMCITEEIQLQNLEQDILAEQDAAYEAPEVLPEESAGEEAYEKVAPYFVSAKSFLKHVLEKNKEQMQTVKDQLHDLLGINHARFKELSPEEQRAHLLNVAVISYAILQDLRVLASKYLIELELCLSFEIIKEITLETAVNGATIILLDMALYHPDHQKDFAQYRQQLYMSISSVDMSIHEFFSIMHGHVSAALSFIKEYKADLSHDSEQKEKKAEPGLLTQAVRFTAFAPPVVEQKAVPKAEGSRYCAIL